MNADTSNLYGVPELAGKVTWKSHGHDVRGSRNLPRKTISVDQEKLVKAQALLGAESESETVDLALSLVIFRHELVTGIERIGGTGGVENVFDAEER